MTARSPTTTFGGLPNGRRFQLVDNPNIGRNDWPHLIWISYLGAAVQQDGDLQARALDSRTLVRPLPDINADDLPNLSDPGVGVKGSWVLRGHEWAIFKEMALYPLLPASTSMLWWRCESLITLPGLLRSRNRFVTAIDVLLGRKLIVQDYGRQLQPPEVARLREIYHTAEDPVQQELELFLAQRSEERFYRLTGYGILRVANEGLILL